jgi:acyl-CoA reductase-like NAD-dependent aldehyde dehydrogenase
VTKDADINLAVKETVLGALSFNGQRCTALKTIFVHQSIANEFIELLNEQVAKLQFGLPWEKGVTLTPLPEPGKPAYLNDLIQDAILHGATVMNENGGTIKETFFYPAILFPVNKKMKIYSEEQFGPIIPIIPFDDIEEPIQYIIKSTHGQQVSLFSKNKAELASLIDPLVNQVSRVNINCQCQRGPDSFPFTGRKDSAEGTLSVVDALRSFSIRSLVAAKLTDENKEIINDIVASDDSNFLSTKFIF